MDLKLKDKVVLVTGGTGGIGTAIVKAFLGEGAKVAFSSTSQKKIDDLIPTLNAAPGQVAGFVADLNKEEDIKNFVEQAKAKLPKDKIIAVYCRSGRRSANAAGILADVGYKCVNLKGGIIAWKEANMPVIKEE